jgi:hypothetical protein
LAFKSSSATDNLHAPEKIKTPALSRKARPGWGTRFAAAIVGCI